MTKHDTETTTPTEPRETYGIPPIPDALKAHFPPYLEDDPNIAREAIATGATRSLTYPTDINNDGIYIGNMWRPILFDDTRNLPYEHPKRHEWDDPLFDVESLDFDYELLPTGWTVKQYHRFRSWEFGKFIMQFNQQHICEISWKAFHGIYDPKLFFFGCNAGWLEPNISHYPLFRQFAPGAASALTREDIHERFDARRKQAMKVNFSWFEYAEERKKISENKLYEVRAYANPCVKFVASRPGFYWKYASYEKLKAIRPPDDPLFPSLDLCDEQYEWDRDVYDRPDLDFSAEPTLPGYTRIQFLRRRAWERSCYEHRVAKLTGKRNKPRKPVVPQDLIDKLNSNN
jgi:hypothetical protein